MLSSDVAAENDFVEARSILVGYLLLPRLLEMTVLSSTIRFAADNNDEVDDRIRMVVEEKAIIG